MISIYTEWKPKSDAEIIGIVKQSQVVLPLLNNEDKLRNSSLLFKALGDETRLKIVGILKLHESCLCELVAGLGIPSSTLTHHLKILERGGVIQSKKEKKFTIFTLVQEEIIDSILAQV